MQAYEFYTTAENGFIRIPDEYKNKISSKFKVIILDEKISANEPKITKITLEEINQLRGIVRSDIDEKTELAKSREERYADFS